MEGLNSAVRAICAVSAVMCVVEALAGGTKLKGQLRLILDLILALVLTAPFVKGGLEFELPVIDQADLSAYGYSQEVYLAQVKAQSEENIASVLAEQISGAGIACENVSVEVNISPDLSIDISKVELKTDSFSQAAEVVRSSLGAETEVVDGNR
ncbi:MAG: hypothetical protein J6M48_07875 [Ruminococcus sp.]|nr:hypothetical protein [Ruminococcus sp.]